VDAAERLLDKARVYELLSASHADRAPIAGTDHAVAATGFTVAAIVLREVAAVPEEEAA
jgi:hypothetical protein